MASTSAERKARALARAARNPHGVAPGQVWQDWDSRYRNQTPRLLTVLAIESAYALVKKETAGNEIHIRLDRFHPSSTGYRQVESQKDTGRWASLKKG